MRNLVNLFNTNDLRYLLDVDELPENYDVSGLFDIYEDIMIEDDELRGDRLYADFIEESAYANKKKIKLTAIIAIQELENCTLFFPDLKEKVDYYSKQFKIKERTYEDRERACKRIIQDIQIQALKNLCPVCGGENKNCKSCEGTGKVKNNKLDYGGLIADINHYTGVRLIDPTVAEYRRHEKYMKAEIKQRKQQHEARKKN